MENKAIEADSTAQHALARQQQLGYQLDKANAKTAELQHLADNFSRDLTASHKQLTALQAQMMQAAQQHDQIASRLATAEGKLQELMPLQPKLAKVSSEAEVCRTEMSALTGSQAKVHESLQAYLRQEKELRQDLAATEQHLSGISQDYAVCQDTSLQLHYDMRQNKVISLQCDHLGTWSLML